MLIVFKQELLIDNRKQKSTICSKNRSLNNSL